MTDPQASHHREHHLRTPTNELTHEEKLKRQGLHMQVLTGVMLLVLAMLIYSAIFDLDHSLVVFRRVEYDIAKTQAKIIAAGLPPMLAERIQEGR